MQNKMTFEEIEEGIRMNPVLDAGPDLRDYKLIKDVGGSVWPEEFSLRDKMSPVKYQGARGTCGGFGGVAVDEFVFPKTDLSEEMFFRKVKDIDIEDFKYDGYGSYIRSVAKALTTFGACLENTVPYRNTKNEKEWLNTEITPAILKEASKYMLSVYVSVSRDPEDLKSHLILTGRPVLAGVQLYESYRQAVNTGFIPVPKSGERAIGGHAMALVGWTKTHWIFKNSWGKGWGDNGYIYWPISISKYFHVTNFAFPKSINQIQMFNDIPPNSPDFIIAQKWKNLGIIKGYQNGNFGPNDSITRMQMLYILENLEKAGIVQIN